MPSPLGERRIEPWRVDPEHLIASANWDKKYPALCYEKQGEFVPTRIIEATLRTRRFAVAVWQPGMATFVDVSHNAIRSQRHGHTRRDECDWVRVHSYEITQGALELCWVEDDLDPRDIMPSLRALLTTPVGFVPDSSGHEREGLVYPAEIRRLVIEYLKPSGIEHDRERLPLDTSIAAMAAVALSQYNKVVDGDMSSLT